MDMRDVRHIMSLIYSECLVMHRSEMHDLATHSTARACRFGLFAPMGCKAFRALGMWSQISVARILLSDERRSTMLALLSPHPTVARYCCCYEQESRCMNTKAGQFISCVQETEAQETEAQEIMHVNAGTINALAPDLE